MILLEALEGKQKKRKAISPEDKEIGKSKRKKVREEEEEVRKVIFGRNNIIQRSPISVSIKETGIEGGVNVAMMF